MFQASQKSTKMVGPSLSEDKTTKNMNDRRKASSGLSLQGSDYISTRKLSIVGRSYAVQSPIVPSIALSATTSLDQPFEDPPFTQGMHKEAFLQGGKHWLRTEIQIQQPEKIPYLETKQ